MTGIEARRTKLSHIGMLSYRVAPRNTTTGGVLEAMVIPSLRRGGYETKTQVVIGTRPGGRTHKVDCVAEKDGEALLISLKWQQTSGTAEQKVPFEIICLLKAIRESSGKYSKAYVVLGGNGWTLRDYYLSDEIGEYIVDSSEVKAISFEDFVGRANNGEL